MQKTNILEEIIKLEEEYNKIEDEKVKKEILKKIMRLEEDLARQAGIEPATPRFSA